jgi:hypothetical protein
VADGRHPGIIVESQGGRISANDDDRHGATFVDRIP